MGHQKEWIARWETLKFSKYEIVNLNSCSLKTQVNFLAKLVNGFGATQNSAYSETSEYRTPLGLKKWFANDRGPLLGGNLTKMVRFETNILFAIQGMSAI